MRYTIGVPQKTRPMNKFQVVQYKGIIGGWLPIGQPRQPKDATRLAMLADRIWPQMHHKITTR